MDVTLTRSGGTALLLSSLAACNPAPVAETVELAADDGRLVLSELVRGDWDRICVAGPYSTSRDVAQLTGAKIAIERQSKIFASDSIALLIFMNGDAVVRLLDVPRRPADFTSLAGSCFKRKDAVFTVPLEGHPYVEEFHRA